MSRSLRKLRISKLQSFFHYADDEEFLRLVWSVNALQSGREYYASNMIHYPSEAATTDMGSNLYVHPWRLETLANELFVARKSRVASGGLIRKLDCSKFNAIIAVASALQKLEDADDAAFLSQSNIIKEMHRLAQRQFEWQRRPLSLNKYYRSGYLYGGILAKHAFENKHKISLDIFCYTCFAIMSQFLHRPLVDRNIDLSSLSINKEIVNTVLDIVSVTVAQARYLASEMRSGFGPVSYKKSILRQYPCVSFGENRQRVITPLPDLLAMRSTTGLFYDTISEDGRVRNEISKRFHRYCIDLIHEMKPNLSVKSEFVYAFENKNYDSPDIFIGKDFVDIICECKATKMSFEAKFSDAPFVDAKRGYNEIVKVVVQIWRFVSHHRRKAASQVALADEVSGMILTLDTWLNMANTYQDDILNEARALSEKTVEYFSKKDMIPICFCTVDDLETTLSLSSESSFVDIIKAAGEERFRGWELNSIYRELNTDIIEAHPYPFRDKIADVFPWWNFKSD